MIIENGKEAGFKYLGFRKMVIGNRFSSIKNMKIGNKRKEYNFEKIFIFKKL
jgi:hypothetical protein